MKMKQVFSAPVIRPLTRPTLLAPILALFLGAKQNVKVWPLTCR